MNETVLNEAAVLMALSDFRDPETGRPLGQTHQLEGVTVDGEAIRLTVKLTSHAAPLEKSLRADMIERLQNRFPQATSVHIAIERFDRRPPQLGQIGLRAASVIAVGSGKGGVGKSTIAASLALAMARAGCRVGLMDADVYGPSIPHLLGVSQRPSVVEREGPEGTTVKKIVPVEVHGLKVISMGFLVDPDQAVIWRGPMLHGAVRQFLADTDWGDLDYLFIDMPPGTGDIALTLSQLLPLSGAVVVCTPQDVALLDAVKAVGMFRQVKIPVLGMVENMSYFLCPDNGKKYDIFGSGGARKRAGELGVPVLGEVPITIQMRERCDAGEAHLMFEDDYAPALNELAFRLAKNLADKARQKPQLPSFSVLG
jgi:ATP-binding protein involved in chromosome partitioning